jgi:hypothetical protein
LITFKRSDTLELLCLNLLQQSLRLQQTQQFSSSRTLDCLLIIQRVGVFVPTQRPIFSIEQCPYLVASTIITDNIAKPIERQDSQAESLPNLIESGFPGYAIASEESYICESVRVSTVFLCALETLSACLCLSPLEDGGLQDWTMACARLKLKQFGKFPPPPSFNTSGTLAQRLEDQEIERFMVSLAR